MTRLLVTFLGFVIAVPAHAVPIVSLHGGTTCAIQAAGTLADAGWVAASLIPLAALILVRIYRRKAVELRRPPSR